MWSERASERHPEDIRRHLKASEGIFSHSASSRFHPKASKARPVEGIRRNFRPRDDWAMRSTMFGRRVHLRCCSMSASSLLSDQPGVPASTRASTSVYTSSLYTLSLYIEPLHRTSTHRLHTAQHHHSTPSSGPSAPAVRAVCLLHHKFDLFMP